jgi:thioredoxin 1
MESRVTAYTRCLKILLVATIVMTGAHHSFSQAAASDAPAGFTPLDQWKSAVIAADANAVRSFYSTDPVMKIRSGGVVGGADSDIKFWLGLKARSMNLQIVRLKTGTDAVSVIFKTEVQTGLPNGQTMSVTDSQSWRKQGEQWRIIGAERTDSPHLAQPSDMKKNLYPADADVHAEIKEAETRAASSHKRVLLIFGANWCYDCHVLDLAFQRPDFADVMANYEVVHIDLGDDGKKNTDVVKQFDASLDKGIPVLAVAESNGTVVVGQKNGEFEDARSLTPQALLEFLNKWKPAAR